jgi:BAAT / Acyl-CoA thioester hydrolase C terminal.
VDDPAALIPVAKIQGPVLLVCGTADQLWTSCAYAETIQDELTAAGDRYPHVLYRYTGAGHFVNELVPYEPSQLQPQDGYGLGATLTANADADAGLWPNLLHFLAGTDVPTGTFTAPASPPSLPQTVKR